MVPPFICNQWHTNQMQLLSTAVTTGLETIDILIIFLKWSEPTLVKQFHFHGQCLDLPIFPDQPTLQHWRDTSQLFSQTLYILHKKQSFKW